MVVGPDFVWLHFPKCGGHTVEMALREAARGRRDIVFDRREPFHPGWHDSIPERAQRDRAFRAEGKTVIAGIRRLPYWILSRVHYEAARPPHHCATREMFCRGEFYEQSGEIGRADNHAAQFTATPVHRWIRLEHLAEDFSRHFTDILGPRTARAKAALRRALNVTPLNYLKAPHFYFTAEELTRLYEANPIWAEVEKMAYGGLLRL